LVYLKITVSIFPRRFKQCKADASACIFQTVFKESPIDKTVCLCRNNLTANRQKIDPATGTASKKRVFRNGWKKKYPQAGYIEP
jgi:hypothetical protein